MKSVPSRFDTERLVGLQLRAISGDVSREFVNGELKKIFSDENNEQTSVDISCQNWCFAIGAYFSDEKKQEFYMNLLILMQQRQINPDDSKLWKFLMKKDLTIQFFKMFDKFTQVPQLAARNRAKPKEDEESDVEWFKLD